jgi:polyhydroxyalkanoate synthesis regulator phasin
VEGDKDMQDAWRAYLELAMGLTEASRKRAEQVARDLLGRGGATAAQLQSAAEELVTTSRANRENLAKLVRYELDRALGAVGLATAEEVSGLAARVRRLEHDLREVSRRAATADAPPRDEQTVAEKAPAKKVPAKKTVAKKTVAKKTVAKKTAAKKTAAKKAPGPA